MGPRYHPVMAAKRCPTCALVNPATALVCDCGWSFVDGAMTEVRRYRVGESPEEKLQHHRLVWAIRLGCLGLILLGVFLISDGVAVGGVIMGTGLFISLVVRLGRLGRWTETFRGR
jgi:hypothetical protein